MSRGLSRSVHGRDYPGLKVVSERRPSCGLGYSKKKGQPELPLRVSLRRVAGEIVQVRYGFGYLLSGACGACGAA